MTMLLDQDTPYGWRRRQARLVPEACELHLFKVDCDADDMATELLPLRHRLLVCDATANGLEPGSFRVQARELALPRLKSPLVRRRCQVKRREVFPERREL